LLFAQGNLGAGKRGSRDREGHSVRYIYKEIFQLSLSLPALSLQSESLVCFFLRAFTPTHTNTQTISAPSSAFIFLPCTSERAPEQKAKKQNKNKKFVVCVLFFSNLI
jgi:hypothetical protein